jgi:hypothetical protein
VVAIDDHLRPDLDDTMPTRRAAPRDVGAEDASGPFPSATPHRAGSALTAPPVNAPEDNYAVSPGLHGTASPGCTLTAYDPRVVANERRPYPTLT